VYQAYPKGGKKDKGATIKSVYGLEWPEPLVTFALSIGNCRRNRPSITSGTGHKNTLLNGSKSSHRYRIFVIREN